MPQEAFTRTAVISLFAAMTMAALSTFGDWLWTRYIPDGAIVPALVHGAVFFVALAAVLARTTRTPGAVRPLLLTLPPAGFLLAAVFYPLAWLVGYLAALLLTWTAMWLATAELLRRARGGAESWRRGALRGVLAAFGSGLAFWAVSGIWTNPAPGGPSYPWHFACWTFAFLPGFLALLIGRPRPAAE